jgi:hypothetical protein
MQKNPALFVSFKAALAIPVRNPLRRDFLIQTTLDPGVRRIDYYPSTMVFDRVTRIDALVLHRDDGRFAVDFVDTFSPEDPQAEALLQLAFDKNCSGLLAISEADVRREPRCTSAREVWGYAAVRINAADRAQIVDALETEGPIPLRALGGLVDTSRDAVEVIYALACEGTVTLDLDAALDDRAIVRAGIPSVRRSQHLHFGN